MNKIILKIDKNKNLLVVLFFFLFLILGVSIYKDYGLSWDELYNHDNGIQAYNYLFENDDSLLTYNDNYYGSVFELVLVILEKSLNIEDSRELFFMRHLVTFLIFYISIIFFYFLGKLYFNDWKKGLLGCLFLILSPRIFAHSFYNSKDLVFLSMFIIAFYTMIRFLDNKSYKWLILHSLASALLISTRILGILIFFLTLVFFIGNKIFDKKILKKEQKKNVFKLILYLMFVLVLMIRFWPTLLVNPFQNLLGSFIKMSVHSHIVSELFLGKYLLSNNLPFYYLPVWIFITTPVSYLVGFIFGFVALFKSFFNCSLESCFQNNQNKFNILLFAWFSIPFFWIVVFKPVIYDAWRHLFFIYPALLLISIKGFIFLFSYIKLKFKRKNYYYVIFILFFIVFLNIFFVTKFMIANHPYQNMYFNKLAGFNMQSIRNNFEFDYWGLSYRKALEFILDNDASSQINIFVDSSPGNINYYILTAENKERVNYVQNESKAEYFIGNYKFHKEDYPYDNNFFSIKIKNAEIISVYKLVD